jgi:hypothetical protein
MESQVQANADKALPAEPTASSLKTELRESLELLLRDFEGLKNFVAEIASEGIAASIRLSKDDRDDLLTITLEIQDAANDIAFEAGKIKDKLERLG